MQKEGTLRSGIAKSGLDSRGRNTRNLPYSEFLKRREEGRCFGCGGPFSLGHHCPERSLRMVILVEDEDEEMEGVETELDQKPMELSTFLARGLTQPRTMKLHGQIGGRTVLILIDSGANHNFIGKGLVK